MMCMERKLFGAVTVLLLLVTIFCVKGTVTSRGSDEHGKRNRYYAVLEQEYRDRTRQLLEEQGLRDCGINIRWIADVDGSREYTISLHHRKLSRMTEEEKSALKDMLIKVEFQDEACSFRYKL